MTIKLDPVSDVLIITAATMDEALTIGLMVTDIKNRNIRHCLVHGPTSGVTLHLTLATHPKKNEPN